MNSFALTATNAADKNAQNLVVTFYSAGGSGSILSSGRFVSACAMCAGPNPSYALIGIPSREPFGTGNWDQVPGVCLNAGGPAGKIKLLSRATVSLREGYREQVLLNGWVVYHAHSIRSGEDSVITCVFDDRHIMHSYYTCFGKMVYEPTEGKHYFLSNPNDPLIFNKGGHGDCIDSPFGPRFAPGHRYGHQATQQLEPSSEPDPGQASTKTRKWRCSDILRYLRDFFYNVGARPALGQDFGLLQLPDTIDWPKDLGSNITEDRTPRELTLEGATLLDALQRVVRYCGPYDIHLEPSDNTRSKLKVIDFNPKDNAGSVIYDAGYVGATINEAMNDPSLAIRANVKESALGYADNIRLTGDAPAVEFMASTDPADTQAGAAYLAFGWDRAIQEELFKGVVKQGGDDSIAFNYATQLYPDVYSWYRIAPGKNPFDASPWAAQAQSGNFRIKPHQLTSYNESTTPVGLVPREIVIEYKLTQTEYSALAPEDQQRGYWRFAGRYSDLQLSPCGRFIQIPGLRDQQAANGGFITWLSDGGSTYEGDFFEPRHIRIQVAVESDHCITASAGTKGEDPNFSLQRIDADAPKFTYLIRSAPMQYVNWYRRTLSYPVGIGGLRLSQQAFAATWRAETLFTDQGDGTLTDPLNRLGKHAQIHIRNHKRVTYEGTLEVPMLTANYKPGLAVAYENGNIIGRVYGVVRCVVLNHDGQLTQIEFGPSEFSTIWDGPLQIMQGGNGGGAPAVPKIDKDTKYDEPNNGSERPRTGGGSGKGSETAYDSSATGSKQGGGHVTMEDEYVASTGFNSAEHGPRTKQVQVQGGEESTPPENRPEKPSEQAARRAGVAERRAAEAEAKGDFVGAASMRKDANRLSTRAENQRSKEQGSAFPTTTVNGRGFDVGSAFGKASSGSIGGMTSIQDAFLGKPSSGSINGQTSLAPMMNQFGRPGGEVRQRRASGANPNAGSFWNRKGPALTPGRTGTAAAPMRPPAAAAASAPAAAAPDNVEEMQSLISTPAAPKKRKPDVREE